MIRSRLMAFAAVAVTIGCSSASVLLLDPTPRPQTHPGSIRLIAQEPQQPYTVIAIVSARAGDLSVKARTRLLKEAARLGGEAILLDTSSLTVVGDSEHRQEQITGKVIVFNRTPAN